MEKPEHVAALWGIIPDVHADLSQLNTTLKCQRKKGVACFAFLGDFIDAGHACNVADDRAVLTCVRRMIDDGVARAVMGNHELNAILFHSLGPDMRPLREHTAKNMAQHHSFIRQIGTRSTEATEWTDWFMTLPLWHDADGFRLVHAYWGQAEIDLIAARRPDGRLKREDLLEVAEQNTDFGKAVQMLVCGPEARLPNGLSFADFKGNRRDKVRIAWWRANAGTWREIGLSVPDPLVLPDVRISSNLEYVPYPADAPAVFCGHYKMHGSPALECHNVLCLDYPQHRHSYIFDNLRLDPRNLLDVTVS